MVARPKLTSVCFVNGRTEAAVMTAASNSRHWAVRLRAVVQSVASMGAVHGKNDFNISVFDTKTAKMI